MSYLQFKANCSRATGSKPSLNANRSGLSLNRSTLGLTKVLLITLLFSLSFLLSASSAKASVKSPVGLRWTSLVKARSFSPLVAKNACLYVGAEDGVLYVFKDSDGSLKWKYETEEKARVSPTVEEGYVFLSTDKGNLYVLDAFNGNLKWSFRGEERTYFTTQTAYTYQSMPLVSESLVFYSSTDGKLYAFDIASGKLRWSFNSQSRFLSSPALSSTTVFVSSSEGVVSALNKLTGTLNWKYTSGKNIDTSCVATGDKVLQAFSDGEIVALDAKEGKAKWTYELGEGITNLAVFDNRVFVSSDNGNLYVLDAPSASLEWKFETEGSTLSMLQAGGGMVYVGSNDGRFYALGASSGEVVWLYDTGGYFTVSPVQAGEAVFGAAAVRKKGRTYTSLTAFDKRWSPGKKIIIVKSKKTSSPFTEINDYFLLVEKEALARQNLSSSIKLVKASFLPVGFLFQTIEHPFLNHASSVSLFGFGLSDLAKFSFHLALTTFWLSFLLSYSSIAVSMILLIFLGCFVRLLGFIGGRGALLLVTGEGSTLSGEMVFPKIRRVFRKTAQVGVASYLYLGLIGLITFLAGVLVLFLLTKVLFLVDQVFLFTTLMWLALILLSGLSRATSLSFTKACLEQLSLKDAFVPKMVLKRAFALMKVFLFYLVTLSLAAVLFSLGSGLMAILLRGAGILIAVFLGFFLLAENWLLFREESLSKSLKESIAFTFNNFWLVFLYILFLIAILFFLTLASFLLVKNLIGLVLFLVICLVAASYLAVWQVAFYLENID